VTAFAGDLVAVRVVQVLNGKYRIRWIDKASPQWVWLPVEACVKIEQEEERT